MTKLEFKEYLHKVYNIEALSVNTMNYAGQWRRKAGRAKKRPAWKKAIVTLAEV
eukprot:CAMPEP_0182484242 /NCGR_PEP_ID=MMETSP1319-20130603/43062_1 /TAXON_ID=172717 /ORGANISM="Bolidomonas pacifica, Strain RCC208" /LENGTH=53 /DNA_ID=CAMNT_0024686129 /DNA_START=121 /DNA_END=279 /DNA_ORIENTATION=+